MSESVAGWFGKMPALGDFASRRLPPEWVAGWDAWLQHELVRSRAALGDGAWLQTYLVAPVRRFWLAPGLLTSQAWLGVLMPSVDSVGRHFPFTLVCALPHGCDGLADALAGAHWLDAADALARQVLDPAFDVAALEQALLALAPPEPQQDDAASGLAQQLETLQPSARCAWWCEGAEEPSHFVLADVLPTGETFDALLHEAPGGG